MKVAQAVAVGRQDGEGEYGAPGVGVGGDEREGVVDEGGGPALEVVSIE